MSPIVHIVAGFLGWQTVSERKNIKTFLLFVLVANFPDLDFLIYLVYPGREGFIHQHYTHNFIFAILVAFLFFGLLKGKRERIGIVLVSLSHLIFDLVVVDKLAPIGLPILYPFTSKTFNFGFFPNLLRGDLAIVFSLHNLVTVALELLLFFLPVAIIYRKDIIFYLHDKDFWRMSR
jgi:hypothetical protein